MKVWFDNVEDLSATNHVQICKDPEFWYDEHVRDLDINYPHH
jgi:hypothetical protein